jgi:peroxiredoxin
MPGFVLPDENGDRVSLDDLLDEGPVAITFHRGHWCPYCRINTRAFAEAQERIASKGVNLAPIMPDRQRFAALFKAEGEARYPVLTDIDNGYALSLNLAIWVGDEMQKILESGGRQLPDYQGNNAWVLPIPATFVIARDGTITARFIDPDFQARGHQGPAQGAARCPIARGSRQESLRAQDDDRRCSRQGPDGMSGNLVQFQLCACYCEACWRPA